MSYTPVIVLLDEISVNEPGAARAQLVARFPYPLMLGLSQLVVPRTTAHLLSLLHTVTGDAQRAVLRAAYKTRSRAVQVAQELSLDDDAVQAQAVPSSELDATKQLLAEMRAAMLAELSWRPPAPWRALLLSQWRLAASTLGAELDEAASMLRLRNQRFDILVRVRRSVDQLETVVWVAAEGQSLLTAADEVSMAGTVELCRSGLVSDAEALSALVGEATALACRRGGHDPYR